MTGFHCLLLRLLLWYTVLLVLLPYHPSVQVTFDLIVSDSANGLKGVNFYTVETNSKYAEEQVAVVFAENKDAGVLTLRTISVSIITKVLFLDASSAKIAVQAYSAESWYLTIISKFLNCELAKEMENYASKYEAPDGVCFVCYVTLVEDISTGATVLKIYPQVLLFSIVYDIYLLYQFYLKPQNVDFIVVANLLLIITSTYLPSRQCRLSIKDVETCSISGYLWYLEIGREYNISFVVTGADNNVIYIPENSIFESVISEEYFKVISRSHNGSCFNEGKLRISSSVKKATAVISKPIEVISPFVAFPSIDAKRIHSKKLLVVRDHLQSMNPEVASIDFNGILLTANLGNTEVIAQDAQNNAYFGKAIVQVLQPTEIAFGKSHLEAEVRIDLILYISLYANSGGKKVTISDCRHNLCVLYVCMSHYIYKYSNGCERMSSYDDSCCGFVLTAVASGDIVATVHFGNSDFCLSTIEEIFVMLGSSFFIRTFGSPRLWILDPSKYYSKCNLLICLCGNCIIATCKIIRETCSNFRLIVVVLGNEASSTNPLLANTERKLRVCCGLPTRLSLSLLRPYRNKCPTNVRAASCSQPSTLAVSAFGHCESGPSMGLKKQLDLLTSLKMNWKKNKRSELSEVCGILKPREIVDKVEIIASTREYKVGNRRLYFPQELQSKMQTLLIRNAKAIPSLIVLLNEKSASKAIRLEHDSGHIALMDHDSNLLEAEISSGLCLNQNFTVTISITDVEEIFNRSTWISLNTEQELKLKVRDMEGLFFITDDADIMNVQLNASSNGLVITSQLINPHYILRSNVVGVVTLLHSIQVYALIQLQPKLITLIPDSVFQLEISGGPQPLPSVQYYLNNTSVAVAGSDGLITNKVVGYAKIIGSVNLDNIALSIQAVSFFSYTLLYITDTSWSNRWTCVDGLNENETPFSFGGALYSLKISWRIAIPDIIEAVSPIDVFSEEVKHFKDQLIVTVTEPLQLTVPPRYHQALRLSPDAKLDLKSNIHAVGDAALVLKETNILIRSFIFTRLRKLYKLIFQFPCLMHHFFLFLHSNYITLHVDVESRNHFGRLFDASEIIYGKRHFQFIDETNGIVVAMDTGNTVIASYHSQKQTFLLRYSRKVVSAKSLRFSSVPQFVSNIRDHQYVFPLIDDSIEQNPSNTYELILDAPSDCTIGFVEKVNVLAISLFAARSTFLPTLGKYGWGPVSLNDYQSLSLNISATWNHVGKVKEVSLIVTFYPRFEITSSDSGGVLRIKKVKSVSLTDSLKCNIFHLSNITVKNAIKGQFEIPVTIVLYGDASKTVLRGLLRSFLEPTFVQVCASLFTVAVIIVLIVYCRGFSFSSYFFSSFCTTDSNATYGSFASDYPGRYLPLIYKNGKSLLGSSDMSLISSHITNMQAKISHVK
uniref:Nuclear pore membrane glycoprotein 210 n=1 Tax=Wuchereria bancrofti TaxID=6293 RepID=A0AAF5Q2G8_WUCBA